MPKYFVQAKVDQIVSKEIELVVTANSEEEAAARCHGALQVYPKPVDERGVKNIVTRKSNYWIPRNIDIVKIEEIKENG